MVAHREQMPAFFQVYTLDWRLQHLRPVLLQDLREAYLEDYGGRNRRFGRVSPHETT